jgi:peptidoglycan/LPS O-acetylase OafA/YrhL
MQFRKDINGLRAIAVIAVVLFHFNASWMPGGFAGVDVFFVISGFLMTGIIFRGITEERFSILKFYVARANRIIPALAVLSLALFFFGWFYLNPVDYKALGKHAGSSISFISNIVYWRESGYFDAASHKKWLLHTWSLSVEWQFYIIYPLVLVAMRKFMSINAMKATILFGTIVCFIFCVFATYQWPKSAYFLLPTRAWEMMIGGVAYLYPFSLKDNRKKIFEWLGLLLIIGSYIFISPNNPWPGYLALFPVLGSFLIIQAQRNDSFITSNIVSQKIGAWSYSIYLWHWPLVVAIYYFSLSEVFVYLGLCFSVLLGFISYTYIEKIKFRNNFGGSLSYLKCKPVYICISVFLCAGFLYKSTNTFYNIPVDIYNGIMIDKSSIGDGHYTWTKHRELDKKVEFNNEKYKVLIIGDSQAGDFINTLYEAGVSDSTDVISRIISVKCGAFDVDSQSLANMFENSPLKISELDFKKCQSLISRVRSDRVVEQADLIILSMSWRDAYLPFILESIANIKARNTKAEFQVVGGKVFKDSVPAMLYEAYLECLNVNYYAFNKIPNGNLMDYKYQNDIFEDNQSVLGFKYINMTNILCAHKSCSVSDKNSQLYYYDTGHLTMIGAKYLGEKIKLAGSFPSFIYSK